MACWYFWGGIQSIPLVLADVGVLVEKLCSSKTGMLVDGMLVSLLHIDAGTLSDTTGMLVDGVLVLGGNIS